MNFAREHSHSFTANVMSMITDRITFAFINKTEQKMKCDQRDYKYFELTTDFIVEIKIIVDNFLDHQSHCCRFILFHLTNSIRWIRSFLLSYLLIFVYSRRKTCEFYFSGFGKFLRDFNVLDGDVFFKYRKCLLFILFLARSKLNGSIKTTERFIKSLTSLFGPLCRRFVFGFFLNFNRNSASTFSITFLIHWIKCYFVDLHSMLFATFT